MTDHSSMIYSSLKKLNLLLARKNISSLSLFVTAVITLILMRIDAQLAGFGGKGAFYLQTAFTRSNFTEILSSWRNGGVDMLTGMIWLNYANAASYAVLFASAMAYFNHARRGLPGETERRGDSALILLPAAAALIDWTSNTLLYLIFSGPSLNEGMIMAYSLLSSAKWFFVMLSLIMLLKIYFSFRKAMKKGAPPSP